MAEHGTRTMYVHYGCRCDACCRAEHAQYLKRKEAQQRTRINSKWGDFIPDGDNDAVYPYVTGAGRRATQRAYNAKRYRQMQRGKTTHTHSIAWEEIAEAFEMKCAICGSPVDPNDKWIGKSGRLCYGRSYPTVDHIIPLKQGGADVMGNVQLACKHCNSAKGAS